MTIEKDNILDARNIGVIYKHRHSFFRHTSYKALNDVSFKVERGETLGIVGKNGCGKSTLLRVLAGVYKPDIGVVTRKCNSVLLLSLGLGFDPALSGRDNAIICGMFLGSRRKEVEHRLGEIVEFAGLHRFIDDPLKTYSSGMRARLAFSVAVNMHADLLLIDEVLSVGDAQFRQKAETAMVEKINSHQSIVFVSHSIGQLKRLCSRVLWLDQGTVRKIGNSDIVLNAYERSIRKKDSDNTNPCRQQA